MTMLIDVQRRFSRLGKIRLGEVRDGHPAKLNTFRLTSPSLDAIKAVADRYGGSVEKWDADGRDEYQVITETNRLDVMIAPAAAQYSLAYESWSAGGLQRRCDGTDAMIAKGDGLVESPCQCDPEARTCKPTLRVNLFLPEVAGFGAWALESRGFNAAAELPGMLDLLASLAATGRPIRAILRLEQRTAKKGGRTHRFAVPVLDLPYKLADLTTVALPAGNGVPAIGTDHGEIVEPVTEQVEEPQLAANRTAPPPDTAPDAPPAPAPAHHLDDVLEGEELARWLAGLHAAMRDRMQPGADEHAELRTLAQVVVGLGDSSLNDLTQREWVRLARALQGIPKRDPNEPGAPGTAESKTAATNPEPLNEPPPASDASPPVDPAATEQVTVVSSPPGDSVTAGEAGVTSGLPQATDSPVEPGRSESATASGNRPVEPVPPAAPSVGTPLGIPAFSVFAAAVLNIDTTAGWDLSELNIEEIEHVVTTMAVDDYDRWFKACSRELRAVLRNQQMSPRQRADRAIAAEAKERLDAAAVGAAT